ncbi:hypothetical protein BOTNAR_0818g00040 [Botryotinia narcissicola]|uniref:Uncharacterized protein n=1 Tax=Botryotinia narcissicola TaxID=278944 RepID=A0A4Z1H8I3_9HELO|nr:hypothetical protein BOTNAR_0818g00040 [Botryotinia narcissicola]
MTDLVLSRFAIVQVDITANVLRMNALPDTDLLLTMIMSSSRLSSTAATKTGHVRLVTRPLSKHSEML